MTFKKIFDKSLSLTLTPVNEGKDLEPFALDIFELMLGESFLNNNQLRKKKGLEVLKSVPTIGELATESPYETEFETAFIYGIAAKVLIADGDFKMGQVYQSKYEGEIKAATPLLSEKIIDVY